MSSTPNTVPAWGILRIADVKAATGICSHTTIYSAIEAGTFPDSIPVGSRAVGWPADEVQAVVAARVAGADDAELRALVQQLHAARHTKYQNLLGRVLGHTTDNPAPAQQRAASHLAVVGGAA